MCTINISTQEHNGSCSHNIDVMVTAKNKLSVSKQKRLKRQRVHNTILQDLTTQRLHITTLAVSLRLTHQTAAQH